MAERALAAGSAFPPLARNTLRLYSMRFCPFAQRTRMVLLHKKIPHEVINVNLKYKPDWFLERNPLGLVPILERNEKVVYESAACDDYLDQVYPHITLTPSDPYVRARHQMLMEIFGQLAGKLREVYTGKATGGDKTFKRMTRLMEFYENELDGDYFGGKDVSMLDFHIWPWFERFDAFRQLSGAEILPPERFPKLTAWVKLMFQLPAVKETMFNSEMHMQFIMSLMSRQPQYDIGLATAKI